MFVFYLILLLVNYRTYGFIASHPRENYSSCFLPHTIWVVFLYYLPTPSWLGTILHDYLWNLLMSFLLTHFDCRISCLNILQIFMLILEQRVRIYIITLFLLYTSDESFISGIWDLLHVTNFLFGTCSCRGLNTLWSHFQ